MIPTLKLLPQILIYLRDKFSFLYDTGTLRRVDILSSGEKELFLGIDQIPCLRIAPGEVFQSECEFGNSITLNFPIEFELICQSFRHNDIRTTEADHNIYKIYDDIIALILKDKTLNNLLDGISPESLGYTESQQFIGGLNNEPQRLYTVLAFRLNYYYWHNWWGGTLPQNVLNITDDRPLIT